MYDFNKTPLGPSKKKSVVNTQVATRRNWAPHGEYAWNIGTPKEQYRCFKFYIVDKKSHILSGSARFLSTHFRMP